MVTPENLFSRPVSSATVGQIILWWEARRLYYNGIILAWALLWGLITQLRKTRDWVSSPLFILTYIFGVQVPANIFFTGGWIADLVREKASGAGVAGVRTVGIRAGHRLLVSVHPRRDLSLRERHADDRGKKPLRKTRPAANCRSNHPVVGVAAASLQRDHAGLGISVDCGLVSPGKSRLACDSFGDPHIPRHSVGRQHLVHGGMDCRPDCEEGSAHTVAAASGPGHWRWGSPFHSCSSWSWLFL